MKKVSAVRLALFAGTALVPALLTPAAGAQIVLGQTASPIQPPLQCALEEPADEFQLSVEAGADYYAPAAGVITSWSTYAHQGPAQSMALKVFGKTPALFTKTVVARDSRTLTPGVLNTFPVAIPVKGGDRIGLAVPGAGAESPCAFQTGTPGSSNDRIMFRNGDVPPGGTISFGLIESGIRLNVSATLLPPPTVASISPAAGSVEGAKVTIAGTNFASVSGVAFGGIPAKRFTVDSEGQISAIAPARNRLAKVRISVTTVAGTATSATTYTYEGCEVPRLKGKGLKASRKQAKRADCKIGKVAKLNGATARTGKVTKQSPKPGKILAPGAEINVTLKP